MTGTEVRFTVQLAIKSGQFESFERIAQQMLAGTRTEPGALGYDFCLNEDRTQCRLVETYADANAVVAHLSGPVVKQLVPKLLETANLTGFEVYGDPGTKGGEILAKLGAKVFPVWRGL
jgi:quinol monooxygenase YgiN